MHVERMGTDSWIKKCSKVVGEGHRGRVNNKRLGMKLYEVILGC